MRESEVLSAAELRGCAVERCRRALVAASSVADRLALLRSLSRLPGGRTDLDTEKLQLSENEHALLPRFGLALTGRAVRILDEEDSCAPDGILGSQPDGLQRAQDSHSRATGCHLAPTYKL